MREYYEGGRSMKKILVLLVTFVVSCSFLLKNIEHKQTSKIANYKKNSVGVLMLNDGYCTAFAVGKNKILTNNHCVVNTTSISFLINNKSYKAKVLKTHKKHDLALLFVSDIKLSPLKIAEMPYKGETVYVLAHPISLRYTLTKGNIAAFRGDMLQINIGIHTGSSGGPIFNTDGDVVGIVYGGISNMFGIPINLAAFGINSNVIKNFIK